MTNKKQVENWIVKYNSGQIDEIILTDCLGKVQTIRLDEMIRKKLREVYLHCKKDADGMYLHHANPSYKHAYIFLTNLLDFETEEIK